MPYSVLKKFTIEAWQMGGHRPSATQVQWAFARVNETKSSGTWGGR